jgi:hypothetical protein
MRSANAASSFGGELALGIEAVPGNHLGLLLRWGDFNLAEPQYYDQNFLCSNLRCIPRARENRKAGMGIQWC